MNNTCKCKVHKREYDMARHQSYCGGCGLDIDDVPSSAEKGCCKHCWDMNVLTAEAYCLNDNCPCHQEPVQEGWEERFDRNVQQLHRKTNYSGEKLPRGAFGYRTEVDWEAVKAFVAHERTEGEKRVIDGVKKNWGSAERLVRYIEELETARNLP